jgi:hypothetical protein
MTAGSMAGGSFECAHRQSHRESPDYPTRGSFDAYEAETGRRAWGASTPSPAIPPIRPRTLPCAQRRKPGAGISAKWAAIRVRERNEPMLAAKDGIFDVLDRISGEFISGQAYTQVNWLKVSTSRAGPRSIRKPSTTKSPSRFFPPPAAAR